MRRQIRRKGNARKPRVSKTIHHLKHYGLSVTSCGVRFRPERDMMTAWTPVDCKRCQRSMPSWVNAVL